MPEYDLNAGVNTVTAQRAANAKFLEGQNALTSQFLDKFGNVINNQGTTADAAARFGEEAGLPTLQKNAFNLNEQILGIPALHTSGTRGFDVNANQLGRIINEKTAQIAPFAQEATRLAQFAENSVNTKLGYLQNDWNRQLLPLTTEKDFLTDRMARETSMYTQDNQNELNAILAKISTGVAIDEKERDRAHALALQEAQYDLALRNTRNTPMAIASGTMGYYTPEGNQIYSGDWS